MLHPRKGIRYFKIKQGSFVRAGEIEIYEGCIETEVGQITTEL